MTDLCFDATAEQNCEQSVNRAIAADGTNPDAYQVSCAGYWPRDCRADRCVDSGITSHLSTAWRGCVDCAEEELRVVESGRRW